MAAACELGVEKVFLAAGLAGEGLVVEVFVPFRAPELLRVFAAVDAGQCFLYEMVYQFLHIILSIT
jgi:hypothetical protein